MTSWTLIALLIRHYTGLARNLHRLEALVRQALVDDLGMLDKEALMRCLQEAALGGAGIRPLHRFNLTLSLLKWLSMQSAWQRTVEAPTEIISMRQRPCGVSASGEAEARGCATSLA